MIEKVFQHFNDIHGNSTGKGAYCEECESCNEHPGLSGVFRCLCKGYEQACHNKEIPCYNPLGLVQVNVEVGCDVR